MTGIICIIDLEYIPYLEKYRMLLEKLGEDYEVIFWKREAQQKEYGFKTVPFELDTPLNKQKKEKLGGFIKYRKFLLKTLKHRKYDKLIVLSTLAGVIIGNYLVRNYKGRFIFDIRDYSYEKYWLFRRTEKRVIYASNFTALSSMGFKNFLPESDKYVLCHNFLKSEIDASYSFSKKEMGALELTFIGAVRHFRLDKAVIDAFSHDPRFNLVFHGYGKAYDQLKEYAQDKDVTLTGRYDKRDKARLLSGADIINAYYLYNETNRYAMANKFYDAAIYKIPLWANPDTYMGKLAIEKGIGINCGLDPDKMYEEYMKLETDKFEVSCSSVLEEVLSDERIFVEAFSRFIK